MKHIEEIQEKTWPAESQPSVFVHVVVQAEGVQSLAHGWQPGMLDDFTEFFHISPQETQQPVTVLAIAATVPIGTVFNRLLLITIVLY